MEKQNKFFIYKTTCLVNNKFYIGMHITTNINDNYLGSGKLLKRSIKKYGKKKFKREILDIVPNEIILKKREKEIITEDLLKNPLCLNLKTGGDGGFPPGKTWGRKLGTKNMNKTLLIRLKTDTEYHEKFCKAISKGVMNSPNRYDWTGKKHSKKTIEKMKKSAIGKHCGEKNSQFGTCWITNGKSNKKIKKGMKLPVYWVFGRK